MEITYQHILLPTHDVEGRILSQTILSLLLYCYTSIEALLAPPPSQQNTQCPEYFQCSWHSEIESVNQDRGVRIKN